MIFRITRVKENFVYTTHLFFPSLKMPYLLSDSFIFRFKWD